MRPDAILKELKAGKPSRLVNVPGAAWPWVVSRLVGGKAPALVVAEEPGAAEDLATALRALLPGREVVVFPAWDVQPYDRLSPAPAVQAQRLEVAALAHTGAPQAGPGGTVIVTSLPALAQRLPGGIEGGMVLEKGGSFPPDAVAAELFRLGYARVEQVHEVGEWARRGGVIDIWPAREEPLRVEFFDDEVERLGAFDPSSQRMLEALPSARVAQVREVVPSPERIETFRREYREMFAGGTNDTTYHQVSEGVLPAHASQLLPLFWEEPLPSLFDRLHKDTLVISSASAIEQAKVWDEGMADAHAARAASPGEGSEAIRAVPPEALALPAPTLLKRLDDFRRVELSAFDDGDRLAGRPGVRGVDYTLGRNNLHAAAQAAATDISNKARDGYRVVLTAPSAAGLNQMLRALESEGAPVLALTEDIAKAMGGKGGAVAVVAPFSQGWVDAPNGLLVVTEADIFGARLGTHKPKRRRNADEVIAHFAELRDGDFVVHEKHGIGKFSGLVTMGVQGDGGGTRQDFLKILYAGDDRLFVPVENLDVLSRYKGAEAGQVTLDRLGGTGWEARKAKVKEDLMAMADELLATAAARHTTVRTPFLGVEDAAEGGMYGEFCAGFPYELTDDQARVMEEVEADFSAGHPMDRLVVGDVGFGKTEVALRAAYLAAAAGRQVAIVCPTTLLARQHYDVFTQRFAGFPMVVKRLSRLVPHAEAKEAREMLAQGKAHIVVGTHALLGKEIKFRNLGLVVIDEEQRFGVAHKERLKSLRANVDILTLTATPIPRTLQMAVGGVRQLSLIATPPVDRQAVTTFVLPWDNKTLSEAIKRELTRGGQVYVVAPHVEDLGSLEDSLQTLVPGLRLGVAHGQLPEGKLEDVMGAFYEGKLDVLLATTIIESGLDVPKANTLIVYRSDRFGLAQLYQLRGRVGRSTRRAFAYFLLPDGGLTGDAARRLQILQRLDGLGAGFTLASYDMDLRGFGNLLGKQQSGNIRDIGFELYNKMLREAVAEKQRIERSHQPSAPASLENLRAGSVVLKLGVTYLIPEGYVPDVAERLQLYRRLANIHDKDGIADFRAELADRYGAPPPEVDCLLRVMELRNRAQAMNVARLEVGEKGVLVAFEEGRFGNPGKLMQHILKHAGVVTVRPDQTLVWHRHLGGGEKLLAGVGTILAELEGLGKQ